jgi:hypothetical protein
MAVGILGALLVVVTVIGNIDAAEFPQAFPAVTLTLPLTALAVAEILLLVLDPVHPEGIVQL